MTNLGIAVTAAPVKSPRNRLLASLPRVEYECLRPHLEEVELEYRQVLYRANRSIEFIYFFETGVGSLHHGYADDTFVPDRSHFRGLAVAQGIDQPKLIAPRYG